MAEVVMLYDDLAGPDGTVYLPRACGRMGEDGLWEGWIEFVPPSGVALRTPQETEQPNWDDLIYWATGLSRVYLEGALGRALRPARTAAPEIAASPAYQGPRPDLDLAPPAPTSAAPPTPHAVLDPFSVYAQGEGVLRRELLALDEDHLRNIITAHALPGLAELDLDVMSRTTLAELILSVVRQRAREERTG